MKATLPRITKKEIAIIKKAQRGDKKAFNTLYRMYHRFVEKVAMQYLKDEAEAQYVANEVFLKVYNNLSYFTSYSSFGGWLRIITNRTAIDYLRTIKYYVDIDGDEAKSTIETLADANENDYINRITYEQLLHDFEKLPESTRKVFELFYIDNYTIEEISKKLDMPTGTIKSKLSRVRKKLKPQNY